jgi:Zn-dependent protease
MSGQGAAWTFALIAFMGPLMHLVLWQGARWYLRNADAVTEAQSHYLGITLQINKFLFILNMIPIPGFDGYHVFSNLLGFIA